MAAAGGHRASFERSDETAALAGAVLAVTGSCASILAIMQIVAGEFPFVAVPTVGLLAALAARLARIALWTAVAIWVLVAPLAHGVGILAPLMMIVLCVILVIGTERMLEWIARDWFGATNADDAAAGWIEDDPTVR